MSDLVDRVMSFFTTRKRAYLLAFGSPAGKEVLKDLAVFCRARETCVVVDGNKTVDRDRTLLLEGRREVWIRIQQHMRLSENELYALAGVVINEAVDG